MRLPIALLTAALLPSCALAQTSAPSVSPETRAAVRQLVGDRLVTGQAYDHARQLADSVGPRLTGSDNYVHAVSWAQDQFRALGLTNIHTESFPMAALWEPETAATGNIVQPRNQTLHIFSAGWSPSTPDAGITGNVIYLPEIIPVEKLDAMKAKIAGNIVLVDNGSFGAHPAIGELVKAFTR